MVAEESKKKNKVTHMYSMPVRLIELIWTNIELTVACHFSESIIDTNNNGTIDGLKENKIWTRAFSLHQNDPNPFNPKTNIRFRISDFGFVSLKIFDVFGREVTTLLNENKQPGEYEVEWNANDVSSGVYYYRLQAGTFTDVKKMLLLK